jgi:hypothetical protein
MSHTAACLHHDQVRFERKCTDESTGRPVSIESETADV